MRFRFVGLLGALALITTIVAIRPGAGQPVAALVVDTPTSTTVPPSTSTSVSTATLTATVPTSTATATATPGPSTAPGLGFPTSVCNGAFPFPTTANVTFTWTGPTNVSGIYLDLSLFDNNFADGTFLTTVLSPGTTSYTWNGLIPNFVHFWRVTGQGLDGNWAMSDFQRFTPCGPQRLLDLQYSCTGGGRATVTFRWAPTSSPGILQYLDLTIFNNAFAPDTFLSAGPLPPSQQALVWQGILANVQHFYRINTLTAFFGWGPSQTGSFVAQCAS
jgi:hypothetical protein